MRQILPCDKKNKFIKKSSTQLKKIKDIGIKYKTLTDEQIKFKTIDLKTKLLNGQELKKITYEGFALVREAVYRVLKINYYDIQLISGLILIEGNIAEIKTGEGKTIIALLPIFIKALYGKSAHVITVNDYLAYRDALYTKQVYQFLGLSVGLIQENMSQKERKNNYRCDIVYVTNTELGFDYLRDNMAFSRAEIVQRPFFFALVDEIDSVLIDEAKTPLIISGPGEVTIQNYLQTTKLSQVLKRDVHYLVDEKTQNVIMLVEGVVFCEKALQQVNLYDPNNPWIKYILNSVKAKELFKKDINYIKNTKNEIIIIDEFTGRAMSEQRWSDGLHQAIEAKESVKIQEENQPLASITYQSLFLMFEGLAGMSGTAQTEEFEFRKIYNLKVITIPTNRPVCRRDLPDNIYKNQYLKWKAITNECINMYNLSRPVLIGTTTIEKSELFATLLEECGIPYKLLNARKENVKNESEIVSQAGCTNTITIATNMAGRGTDILLGGNSEHLIISSLKNLFNSLGKDLTQNVKTNGLTQKPRTNELKSLIKYKNASDHSKNRLFIIQKNKRTIFKNLIQSFCNTIITIKKEITADNKNEVIKLGGLYVIGTERHDSKRIDNQLRGRSGRQGNPGTSKFFISLEDKIFRFFGNNSIVKIMQDFDFYHTNTIKNVLLNRNITITQQEIERFLFANRKELFEYDQNLAMQRTNIYKERTRIIRRKNVRDWIIEYAERTLYDLTISTKKLGTKKENYNVKVQELLGISSNLMPRATDWNIQDQLAFFKQQFQNSYNLKEIEMEFLEPGLLRELEKTLLLQQIDFAWKDHLKKINFLKDSIKWRAYGQKNPLTEYKRETLNLFVTMLTKIRHRTTFFLLNSKVTITP